MKKLLSLVLALSLCLSSVILLASCKGPSAYEVAVANGFTGSETEWLESLKGTAGEAGKDGDAGNAGAAGYPGLPGNDGLSEFQYLVISENYKKTVKEWLATLKGADGKDGHNVVVTVDSNGYWVIDGTKQTVKVDGSKAKVTSVELAQKVYSVVKSGTAPTLEIKVKYDDGAEAVLPVSNSVIPSSTYDLTKDGVYPVTISYGGVTAEDTITVEGLMVLYENFNNISDSANMAEILDILGWKLPVGSTKYTTDYAKLFDNTADNLANVSGVDLTPYAMEGWLRRPNYVFLRAENGRLFVDNYTYNPTSNFDEAKSGTFYDGVIWVKDGAYMSACLSDTYTIQFDVEFGPLNAKGNMYIAPHYGNDGVGGKISRVGYHLSPSGNLHERVSVNGTWKQYSGGAISILNSVFGDQETMPENLVGQNITVKMVMVNDLDAENYGINYYVRPAGAKEFVLVSTFADDDTTTVEDNYTTLRDLYSNLAICIPTSGNFYLDNFAIWTGTGDMPTNISTAGYEALLTPAA